MKSQTLIDDILSVIALKKVCYKTVLLVDKNRPSSKVRLFVRKQLNKLDEIQRQIKFLPTDNSKNTICRLAKLDNYIRKNF